MGIRDFKSASKSPTDAAFTAKLIGANAIRQMLQNTPNLERKFVLSEMWRFTRRVRRKVVKERLKGLPGIKWRGPTGVKGEKGTGASVGSTKNLGKNIVGWVEGKSAGSGDIVAKVKISRLLRVHEDGLRISARKSPWLIIRDPKDRRRGKIVARVKAVDIPARLGFTPLFKSLGVDALIKVENAMDRAARILEKRANAKVKRTGSGLGSVFGRF